MDKLRAIRTFVQIADDGSLTAAAAALGMSLPAVVQHAAPAWWEAALSADGLIVPGSVLTAVGLPVPVLGPAQGYLLEFRAV